MIRRTLSVAIFLSVVFGCISMAADIPNGLGFYSNDLPIANRTSYNVFNGYHKATGESLIVNLELSVPDPGFFGHIMQLNSKGGDEFSLVLVNFRDKDNIYLELNTPVPGVRLSHCLPREQCRDGIWHKIAVSLDFNQGVISLDVNNDHQRLAFEISATEREFECIFGKSIKYTDVPRIAIRDLGFRSGNQNCRFLLNETGGSEVRDTRGSVVGSVENPEWLINKYYFWEKKADFFQPGITFAAHDSREHKIVFYNRDSTFVYDIGIGAINDKWANGFEGEFAIEAGGMFYNRAKDELMIYNTLPQSDDDHSIAFYDYKSRKYMAADRAVAVSKLHHHNTFTDSTGENIYIFGGYGNYSYSNTFYRYNKGSHEWAPRHFTGDTIPPRFFAATGTGASKEQPGTVYLFGGFGNLSGKQEDGAHNFYDLYRIDADNCTVEKIFEAHTDSIDFVVPGSMAIMPDEGSLYVFGYNHNIPHTKGYIYRFGLDGQFYGPVSDGVDIVSERISSKVLFFYEPYYEKMLCITLEAVRGVGTHIIVNTISSPPYPILQQSENLSPARILTGRTIAWISLFLGCLVVGAICISRRKSQGKGRSPQNPEKELDAAPAHKAPTRNSIYLLGDFTVYDRNSRDITHRFSSKIRQLFFLVLLNSGKDINGISSAEISTTLWPEKGDSRNIRGVTVKALRDILADMDGVQLVQENYKWRILIDKTQCTCDYISMMDTLPPSVISNRNDRTYMSALLTTLMRGSLMHHHSYKWLDPFKFRFEEHIEGLLKPLIESAVAGRDHSMQVRLANCMLLILPLSEEYLKVQLSALRSLGKNDEAKAKFRLFADEYRKSYGKELPEEEFL